MPTVTYDKAAELMGISASSVKRRIDLTGVPVEHHDGRAYVDPETLADAWAGRREAMTRRRVGGATLNIALTPEQREVLESLIEPGETLSSAARRILAKGITASR